MICVLLALGVYGSYFDQQRRHVASDGETHHLGASYILLIFSAASHLAAAAAGFFGVLWTA